MAEPRIEKDSLGEIEVPAGAYYGAQTERARRNFPVSGLTAAEALPRRGGDDQGRGGGGQRGAGPGAGGGRPGHPAGRRGGDRRQARRPVPSRHLPDRLGHLDQHERQRGDRQPRHRDPRRRDRLEDSRSIPTTTSTSASRATTSSPRPSTSRPTSRSCEELEPALERLADGPGAEGGGVRSRSSRSAAPTSRTRCRSGSARSSRATPSRRGTPSRGWRRSKPRLGRAAARRHGRRHGLNAPPEFAPRVIARLAERTGCPFVPAPNHFEAHGRQGRRRRDLRGAQDDRRLA